VQCVPLMSATMYRHSLHPRLRHFPFGESPRPRSLRLTRLIADLSTGITQQTPRNRVRGRCTPPPSNWI